MRERAMIRWEGIKRRRADMMNSDESFEFEDIINEHRPEHNNDDFAHRHPKMRRSDRAKIFAPYAALTGHSDMIKTKAFITQRMADIRNIETDIYDDI